MAGYAVYDPLDVPKRIADGIWIVDGPLISYSIAGLTIPCPTRMTVMETPEGLCLHSPIAFTKECARAIDELGSVRFLVVPNTFHKAYMLPWAEHYRGAVVLAPPGVDLPGAPDGKVQTLTPGSLPGIDHIFVDAGAWIEAVFLHRASETAVFTDLIQHFETERMSNPLLRLFLTIGGATGKPPSASREMRFAARTSGRRSAVRDAFAKIKEWHPKRVLFAHGRLPRGATGLYLNAAFRWAG